jgi:hypothetical protein
MPDSQKVNKLQPHILPIDHCPWCGAESDRAGNVNDAGSPEPGDVSICLWCTLPLQFDENMRLAKITDSELRERLDADNYDLFMRARRYVLEMDRSKIRESR